MSSPLRPRYGRLGAAGASLGVTLVALLGGVGVLPTSADDQTDAGPRAAGAIRPAAGEPRPTSTPTASASASPSVSASASPSASPSTSATAGNTANGTASSSPVAPTAALPTHSGQGRRVVFSEGEQRVWLVGADGAVQRTYLVSGSLYDNLDPGRYEVYSRSAQAWGIDDSGTMRWFVRFAHGDNAAIGFHSIPVDDGRRVQTVDQLGTPRSHGCIRQRTPDAKAMWAFAPIGTRVVVV